MAKKDHEKAAEMSDEWTPYQDRMAVIDEFPIKYKPAKVATLYAIPYLPTLVLIVGQPKNKHQLVEWLEERL